MKHKNSTWFICLLLACISASALAHTNDRRTPVVQAVERVAPAVVNIGTSIRQSANPFRGRSPLSEFFDDFMMPKTIQRESLGTGVIIRDDGYILTNNHVIAGASQIKVTLSDEREFEAELIGSDPRNDLAVIKIDPEKSLPVATMASSKDILIGETVIAIGNPFGLSHTVTTGVVSAQGRDIRGEDGRVYTDFIQIDASINPGNSGGPLLNINGELIGINSAIYRSAEGIGFAIPINRAKRIVDDLINFGRVRRGYIGFFVEDLTVQVKQGLGWSEKGGALVNRVLGQGPGSKAGITPGDIVYEVDGQRISGGHGFTSTMSSYTDGDEMAIGIFRNGKKKNVRVKATVASNDVADQIIKEWLGLEIKKIEPSDRFARKIKSDQGVVVTDIEAESELGRIGVEPGDVIRKINRSQTNTIDGFRQAVLEAVGAGSAIVFIQRGGQIYQVTIGN